MKHGWEIKKLGEVCEIQGGSTPKRTESLFWENGTYPWFTVEDIREQGRIITDTKQKVTKIAWDRLRVFPEDTILLCCTASLGEYALAKIPLTSNQQFNGLVIKDKKYLSPMFLMYYCATLKNKLYSLSGKATIDFVSTEKVRQILIPIPPLSEQEKIVAELDCLSGIIEKKKQQLKELDALAQSIFYEMFGNPIDNEKGWNKIRIGEFSTCIAGATPSTKIDDYWNNGNIPWLSSGEVGKGRIYETDKCITQTGYDSCSTRLIPPHTIVMAMAGQGKTRGTVGVVEISCCTNQSICSIVTNDTVDVDFLYYQLALLYQELRNISNGDGGRGGLNIKLIQNFRIIAPPLDMQKQFAKKILHIEKQKELIKQSIAEAETLFNSRMDYYFS